MKILSIISFLILLQSNGAIFESDLLPGEGPYEFEAAATRLQLHELPFPSSRISQTIKVSDHQRLPWDDQRYRTIKVGHIRVLKPSSVDGRVMGPIRHLSVKDYQSDLFRRIEIEVTPATNIEYLQYRAEGNCFIRIKNDVIEAGCPWGDKSAFKLDSEPKTEEWIHLSMGSS